MNPGSGAAFRLMVVETGVNSMQSLGQEIPLGVLSTRPEPVTEALRV
jgi:hypothetical protein